MSAECAASEAAAAAPAACPAAMPAAARIAAVDTNMKSSAVAFCSRPCPFCVSSLRFVSSVSRKRMCMPSKCACSCQVYRRTVAQAGQPLRHVSGAAATLTCRRWVAFGAMALAAAAVVFSTSADRDARPVPDPGWVKHMDTR